MLPFVILVHLLVSVGLLEIPAGSTVTFEFQDFEEHSLFVAFVD